MDERRMIGQMLARPSWLWQRDLEFVKSVSRQLEGARSKGLSERQAEVIRKIYERFRKNLDFLAAVRPAAGSVGRYQKRMLSDDQRL